MNKIQSNEYPTFQDDGVSLKKLSPLKAIRAKCLDCAVYQPTEVRLCHISDCALYPYRMGKNFSRRGLGNKLAFSKKSPIGSIISLSASVANVNASVAANKLNSSTELINRKEK